MTREEANSIIQQAVSRLLDKQHELLELDVTERALSHHLACYVRELVPEGLHVDVEYNRQRADPKRLWLEPRRATDRDLRATTVFPDILVHRRTTDEFNFMVIEVKKPGGCLEYDRRKLLAFRAELGYLHTAHLILGRNNHGELIGELSWVEGKGVDSQTIRLF